MSSSLLDNNTVTVTTTNNDDSMSPTSMTQSTMPRPPKNFNRSMTPAETMLDSLQNSPKRSSSKKLLSDPQQQRPKSQTDMVLDTMAGMRELAVESVSGFKEWASSPYSDELNEQLKPWSTAKATPRPSTTAAASSCESSTIEAMPPNKDEKNHSFVHDLLSPLWLCGGSDRNVEPEEISARMTKSLSQVMKPSSFVVEQVSKEEEESSDSISLDTQLEEEMFQIQRLTSWNTIATEQTYGTHVTYETLLTADPSWKPSPPVPPKLRQIDGKYIESRANKRLDDDGNPLPPGWNPRSKRRKRMVQFEYPPVRSVKECPRPDPALLPKLFFTEEELDQFEADRYNTRISDDVEIIAVASPLSEEEQQPPKSSPTPCLTASSESSEGREPPPPPPTVPRRRPPRLIKGVQIYMRERSTG